MKYVQSPQSRAREAIVQIGISPNVAELILEMSAAWNSRLAASETRSPSNTTPTSLEAFLHEQFLPAYRGMASNG